MTLMRIPKKRGFKSLKYKNKIVNIAIINENFKDSDIINPNALFKKGLIDNLKTGVKVLGKGELKLKNLKFENVKMSESVKEMIRKMSS